MKHKSIHNLGQWAHKPKATNVNFSPKKSQTKADMPKVAGPTGDKGKKATHPGFTKGGKKVSK